MGRVDWTLLEPGDSAEIDPFNALFEDLETEIAAVDGRNLRPRSIDRRSIEVGSLEQTWFVAGTSVASATNTAYAVAVINGTSMEIDFQALLGGAGLVLEANDWLWVRASAFASNGGTGGGIPAARWLTLAIGVRESGGAYVQHHPRPRGNAPAYALHAAVGSRHAVRGARTIERVALFSRLDGGAGTYYLQCGVIVATVYRRCA